MKTRIYSVVYTWNGIEKTYKRTRDIGTAKGYKMDLKQGKTGIPQVDARIKVAIIRS